MLGDVVVYRNMNSSERSKVIEGIKDDWMSDHNKESFKLFPSTPEVLYSSTVNVCNDCQISFMNTVYTLLLLLTWFLVHMIFFLI